MSGRRKDEPKARWPVLVGALGAAVLVSCARTIGPVHPLAGPEAAARTHALETLALEGAPLPSPEEAHMRARQAEPPARIALGLDEVRRAALANNLALGVQLLSPAISQALLSAEEARFEAAFFVAARAGMTETPTAGATVGSGASTRTVGTTIEPGLEIPLPNGSTVTLSLPVTDGRMSFRPSGTGTGGPESEAALRLGADVPLLRGAGVDVNTASIQVARLRNRQEEAAAKLLAIRVLANAERAYWELWAAAEDVSIQLERYENAKEQLRIAEQLAAKEVVAGVEVVRAEAGLAARLEPVILSETTRRLVERSLKRILNLPAVPVGSMTVLLPGTRPAPMVLVLDREHLVREALSNRMELLEIEIDLAVDEVGMRVARNATLPAFALTFEYVHRGFDTSLGRALEGVPSGDFRDFSVGARLDVPLGNQDARARLRAATLERARTLATRRDREQAIQKEVLDAADELEQSWRSVLAGALAEQQSAELLEKERLLFQEGVRTTTDVLEAADFLATAKRQKTRALRAYHQALVDLAFATGTILGQSRVHWGQAAFAGARGTQGRPEPGSPANDPGSWVPPPGAWSAPLAPRDAEGTTVVPR